MDAVRSGSGKARARMKTVIKKIRNIKYYWKVLLAMLVVSFVPLSICGGVYRKESREFVEKELMQSKTAQMRQVAQELEGRQQIYEHITDYLLSMESLQNVLALDTDQLFEMYKGYRDVVDPMLETNKYYHPSILQMTIYLKDIDLEHGYTIAPYYMLQTQEWFQDAYDDSELSEKWIISREEQTVYYVRPIRRYGRLQAVLVTTFDYEEFLSGLESLPTYTDEMVALVNEEREVLYSNLDSVTSLDDFNTEDYVIRNEEIAGLNVWMLCAFPRSMIRNSILNAMQGNTILQWLSLTYAIVASILLARTLVKRVEKLSDIVRGIGEQHEGRNEEGLARLRRYDGPEDEIGVLVKEIGGMVERLDELNAAVYREKIARRDLEMKALQAQINPHFLYNSLSIINWKAIDAENDEVSSITLKLAEFYRTTLNKGSSIILVEGEVRNIRSYLDIQLIMHDDNFAVHWDVDERVMNWRMPKLVLQPLVENALEHGLDLKENEDRQLWITIWTDGENLTLIVKDNGVGMPQEKADSLIHYEAKGYGVKNVKERIALLYGENHVFRITSQEGEGTEVYIRIPGERGEKS